MVTHLHLAKQELAVLQRHQEDWATATLQLRPREEHQPPGEMVPSHLATILQYQEVAAQHRDDDLESPELLKTGLLMLEPTFQPGPPAEVLREPESQVQQLVQREEATI